MTEHIFTFLFTDVEGSTRMWEQDASIMSSVLARHDAILHEAVKNCGGEVFKTIGDAFCAVFTVPTAALSAAIAAQKRLRMENLPLRVRMSLNTGWAEERDDDYFGPTLNRTARILSAAHGTQILLSGATRDALADDLPPGVELRDLGTHRLRDLSEPVRVFHVLLSGVSNNFAPLKSLTPRPTNIPASLTSFVGREREITEIDARLRRVRLLTLLGPGGIGKTRLSQRIAENLRDEYEHGVFFVGLGLIRQTELFPDAVARALGVDEGENLLYTLKEYLRERHMLLVFDNFEQILDAAPVVNELLAAAPRLKVLATSREALFIYGENTYTVEPLPVPDERHQGDWTRFPSMALFLDRVRAALPDFTPTDADAANVGEICRRLDGLPLAIELAAARMRHLTLEEIVSQLTTRLTLLSSGPRDLPKRQQTMRGAIDWSYDLLAPDAQKLFAHLAVFIGRFTAEAAKAVAGDADLERLVGANLLRQENDRFEMLEVLREYALERLSASGQLLTTQRQHAAYFRDYLETADPHLTGANQAQWYIDLEEAHHNLRAALEWSFDQHEYEIMGRISAVIWRLWLVHSHLSEGHQRLAQALNAQDQLPDLVRAKVLRGASRLEFFRLNYPLSEALLKQSLSLFQAVGDIPSETTCLLELGEIRSFRGDYAEAERYFSQTLALMDNPYTNGRLMDNLGSVARMLGNYNDAEMFYRESLEVERATGSPEGRARVLNNLADMLRTQGKYTQAIDLYNESLELYRQLDIPYGVGGVMLNIAAAERELGNNQRVVDLSLDTLSLLRELDEIDLIVAALIGLAGAFQQLGEMDRAVRLCAAISVLVESEDLTLESSDQAEYERTLASIRADDRSWAAAQVQGRSMSLEHALDFAFGSA